MTEEIMNAVSGQVFGVWFLIGAALVFWMQVPAFLMYFIVLQAGLSCKTIKALRMFSIAPLLCMGVSYTCISFVSIKFLSFFYICHFCLFFIRYCLNFLRFYCTHSPWQSHGSRVSPVSKLGFI